MESTTSDWNADLERWIHAACVMEATARKPGNVTPEHDFTDLTYEDFLVAAECVAKPLAQTRQIGVGAAILESVARTRSQVASNPNLGITLLFAPLAAVPPSLSLQAGIEAVLDALTVTDAERAYEAIRVSRAGGLGKEPEADVSERPKISLTEAMRLAADRDRIAEMYVTGFAAVLVAAEEWTVRWLDCVQDWDELVVGLYLQFLAAVPDSLIARKRDWKVAQHVSELAKSVLGSGWPRSRHAESRRQRFDEWLREDGNARNPGTSADLVAATLFAMFRDGILEPPDMQQISNKRSLVGLSIRAK